MTSPRQLATWRSLPAIQAAVTYYGVYTDEIDQRIQANEQEAAEAHAAWMAGKNALQR